jgi:hypothetical protein
VRNEERRRSGSEMRGKKKYELENAPQVPAEGYV